MVIETKSITCTCRESNKRPFKCQVNALPLRYKPFSTMKNKFEIKQFWNFEDKERIFLSNFALFFVTFQRRAQFVKVTPFDKSAIYLTIFCHVGGRGQILLTQRTVTKAQSTPLLPIFWQKIRPQRSEEFVLKGPGHLLLIMTNINIP